MRAIDQVRLGRRTKGLSRMAEDALQKLSVHTFALQRGRGDGVPLLVVEAIASASLEGVLVDARSFFMALLERTGDAELALRRAPVPDAHAATLQQAEQKSAVERAVACFELSRVAKEPLDDAVDEIEQRVSVLADAAAVASKGRYGDESGDGRLHAGSEDEALLAGLAASCARDDLDPIEQAAYVLVQAELAASQLPSASALGRALTHIIFQRCHCESAGIVPLSFGLAMQRQVSRPALAEAAALLRCGTAPADAMDRWVEVFAAAVLTACDAAMGLLIELDDLDRQYRERMAKVLSRVSGPRLLCTIFEQPVLTVASAARRLDLSSSFCSRALRKLESIDVLRRIPVPATQVVYMAPGIVDAYVPIQRALVSSYHATRMGCLPW